MRGINVTDRRGATEASAVDAEWTSRMTIDLGSMRDRSNNNKLSFRQHIRVFLRHTRVGVPVSNEFQGYGLKPWALDSTRPLDRSRGLIADVQVDASSTAFRAKRLELLDLFL